jgi:hypothetical protein
VVLNDARADLGLDAATGVGLLLWLVPWLFASLGMRSLGLGRAVRELLVGSPAASALSALGLLGWPLGLVLRISPIEQGLRERPFNEALYFFEQSGFVLWLFTAVVLGGLASATLRRGAVAVVAALSLPSSVEYVWQERTLEPRRLAPALVEATLALAQATRPGDVVLVKPERQRHPPPPLLVGRRVPYTRFIPFFAQLAPRAALVERYEIVSRFFETEDPQEARRIARGLHATALCLGGADDVRFEKATVLEPVFEREGASVWRVR